MSDVAVGDGGERVVGGVDAVELPAVAVEPDAGVPM
jgi:hypothetical protein